MSCADTAVPFVPDDDAQVAPHVSCADTSVPFVPDDDDQVAPRNVDDVDSSAYANSASGDSSQDSPGENEYMRDTDTDDVPV